jgi:hypothetical protein
VLSRDLAASRGNLAGKLDGLNPHEALGFGLVLDAKGNPLLAAKPARDQVADILGYVAKKAPATPSCGLD